MVVDLKRTQVNWCGKVHNFDLFSLQGIDISIPIDRFVSISVIPINMIISLVHLLLRFLKPNSTTNHRVNTCPLTEAMENSGKYMPVDVSVHDAPLAERFVDVASAETLSHDAHPYLEVVAPATLPEGYTFEAESNGHTFTVKVPVGGVERGQKFSVPFLPGSIGYSGSAMPRVSVPVGHWKDGVCDCFRLGIIHPVLWSACCCQFSECHRAYAHWLSFD